MLVNLLVYFGYVCGKTCELVSLMFIYLSYVLCVMLVELYSIIVLIYVVAPPHVILLALLHISSYAMQYLCDL